jgi:hypothetical protein
MVSTMNRKRAYTLGGAILALLVAVPVLAGTGNGKENAPGQQKEKTPKVAITLNGTIETGPADEDGKASYTLTDGGKTYTLEAGPKWFFDAASYPLAKYVGKNVKVEGEIAEGSTEVDVISIDGTALRAPGKPPWAGGWKVVGEKHPGWSQEKADRMKAKFGDCFPPGQCKDKPNKGADDTDDETPEAE